VLPLSARDVAEELLRSDSKGGYQTLCACQHNR
jgi:hypothetical protein